MSLMSLIYLVLIYYLLSTVSVHRDDAFRPRKTMDTRRTKRSRPSPPNNDEEAVSPPANVGSTSTEPQPRASRSDTLAYMKVEVVRLLNIAED